MRYYPPFVHLTICSESCRSSTPGRGKRRGVGLYAPHIICTVLTGQVFSVFILVSRYAYPESPLIHLQNRYSPALYQTWVFFGLPLRRSYFFATYPSRLPSRFSTSIYASSEPIVLRIVNESDRSRRMHPCLPTASEFSCRT